MKGNVIGYQGVCPSGHPESRCGWEGTVFPLKNQKGPGDAYNQALGEVNRHNAISIDKITGTMSSHTARVRDVLET